MGNLPTPVLIVVVVMMVIGVFYGLLNYRNMHNKEEDKENKDGE